MDYLFSCVHNYTIEQLEELWKYLNTCFFSRLDSSLILTEKKLHLSLRRYYITHAITTQHKEKAIVLLSSLIDSLGSFFSFRNSLNYTAMSCATIPIGRIGMVSVEEVHYSFFL